MLLAASRLPERYLVVIWPSVLTFMGVCISRECTSVRPGPLLRYGTVLPDSGRHPTPVRSGCNSAGQQRLEHARAHLTGRKHRALLRSGIALRALPEFARLNRFARALL
jgi:hypothetical protein